MAHATIKDIARRSGLSIGTVDRVLHNRGRVSGESARRVREAVRDLQYRPNRAASSLKLARQYRFDVLIPCLDSDGGYWRQAAEGMEEAAAELAHHYVLLAFFEYDRFDPASFDAQARAQAADPGAGIIIAPALSHPAGVFVKSVADRPVVVFDGELPDSGAVSSIAQDSFESGLVAGRLLQLSSSSPRLATVTLGRNDYHLARRREGFVAYFADKPAHDLVHLELDGPEADRELSAWMEAEPTLGGIFVTNSAAHRVAAILGTARPPAARRPALVGYDLIPENIDAMRAGQIDFLFNQQPRRQGRSAVIALYRHVVLGETVEPRSRIPIDIVIRESLEQGAQQ